MSRMLLRAISMMPKAPAGSRYWRMNILSTNGGFAPRLSGLQMQPSVGGPDITVSAGGVSSSAGGDWYSLTDNTTSTSWFASVGSPQWAYYDMSIPVSVAQVTVTSILTNYAVYSPQTFEIQSSPDNVTWTTKGSFTAAIWSAASTQTFVLP